MLRCEAAVGAELVGGGPEAFLQRVVGGVSFRWGDPVHKFCQTDEGAKASGNQDREFPFALSDSDRIVSEIVSATSQKALLGFHRQRERSVTTDEGGTQHRTF